MKGAEKFRGKVLSASRPAPEPTVGGGRHPLSDKAVFCARIQIREIPLSDIQRDPDQPRKVFDEESLNRLANSIASHGVLQPVLLSKNGDSFTLVAGERRVRAAAIAGLKTIPAIVRDYENNKIVSLLENTERQDLSPVEESLAIRDIIESGCSQKDAAKLLGRSEAYISQAMRIASFAGEYGNVEELADLKMSNGATITREHLRTISYRETPEERTRALQELIATPSTTKQIRKTAAAKNRKTATSPLKVLKQYRTRIDPSTLLEAIKTNKRKSPKGMLEELRETKEALLGAANMLDEVIKAAEAD